MRDSSFGRLVAKRRREKQLSQFQLGKLVGVTDKAISKWETGETKPRIEHCARLALALDISLDVLLGVEFAELEGNDAPEAEEDGTAPAAEDAGDASDPPQDEDPRPL